MRNEKKTQGFTLIELLIVIAIIGILAAVLIPNLMNARVQAQNRAAQAYSSQVYTATTAILAEDMDRQPSDFDSVNCGQAEAQNTVTAGGETYNYGWPAAPGNLAATDGCSIDGDDTTGTITVEVNTSTGTTFVNGAEQAATE